MNLGTLDRLLRILLGTLLLFAFLLLPGRAHWIGLLGIVPLLTASLGWCPAYALFGLNTREATDDDEPCAGDCAAPKPKGHRDS